MRGVLLAVMLLFANTIAALDNSTVNSTVTKLTSPLQRFSADLLRRQPAKRPMRPVTLHRTSEPPIFLQPTFEPFDPSLNQLSSRLTRVKPTFEPFDAR